MEELDGVQLVPGGHIFKREVWHPDKADVFAYKEGEFHFGPICLLCGEGFCDLCHPEKMEEQCPKLIVVDES